MKILLAEDDEDISELIKIYLESEGHEVFIAHNGSKAIELLRTATYVAFVLDLKLPDTNGLEIAKTIRNTPKYEKSPIFLVSGSINKSAIEKIKALNITEVHVKPFDVSTVVTSIQRALATIRHSA